jgi:hypothetical protein
MGFIIQAVILSLSPVEFLKRSLLGNKLRLVAIDLEISCAL